MSFSYQWLADDSAITDATGSTYTLVPGDEGKAIKVQVSFTDNADNEETLTSVATGTVAAAPTPNNLAKGAPTISGTAQVGETLTADTSGIADDDGLENVSFSYQWLADDAEIAAATGVTYTLSAADEGKVVKVQVSFTDDADNEETLTSVATGAVAAAPTPNNLAKGAPTISGTAQVGETLTADTSGIADADGLSNVSYSYQWLTDDAAIAGATANTYTLADSDEGKTVTVQVSFTDDAGNDEAVTSGPTDTVASKPNSPATGAPTIIGTVQVGETLTVVTSGIADDDGLEKVSFSYQWLSSRDTEIQGATDATYTLAVADEGKAITVQVSFTDDAGNDETLTSAATDAVSAAPHPNNPATGAPAITGTAQVGEALTADTSGIADADGLENVSFTYQWLADDTEIAGATGWTYTLADTDEGKAISVQVTFTDDVDNDETLTSAATDAVAAADNRPATGLPTIGGTVQVEETLTADTTGIADADGLTNVSFNYQWIRSDGNTDTDIAGETDSTYTLVSADVGKTIKVKVSFSDDANNLKTLTSAATATVAAKPNTAPTGLPTISGTAQVGQTLTADTTGIADADGLTNVSFSYQWIRSDGNTDTDIAGETDSTYTPSGSDVGKTIKVKVSFTDDANNAETLTSEGDRSGGCQAQHCAHGPAHHQRDGPGGRDADGGHVWHCRRRRAGRRRVQLPVDCRWDGHPGRHLFDLHPGRCRRGQGHQGTGQLYR